jgi:hypothetical protein
MEISQTDDLAGERSGDLLFSKLLLQSGQLGSIPPLRSHYYLVNAKSKSKNKIRNSVSLKFCEVIKCLEVMITNQGLVEHGVPCREWVQQPNRNQNLRILLQLCYNAPKCCAFDAMDIIDSFPIFVTMWGNMAPELGTGVSERNIRMHELSKEQKCQ